MKLGFTAMLLITVSGLFSQTVQEGKRLLFMHRYQSAKTTLEKVVAAAPTNAEAIYWLAQAQFELKDLNGAKEVLRKGMEGANGSNPLLLVAMGQVELAEKKTNDARQRFETAISLTKGKDVSIFAAIGRANLEEGGDPAYGIEKLKQGTTVKGFKDAMTHIYMGDLYRKLMRGGDAVSSYENALMIEPKSALAKHKIGKIYLTQGFEQKDIFMGKFNGAVEDDPTFAPALYDMYVFYYSRDVNKATEMFNKYKEHAEPGPALDYEEASLQFAAGDFKNAIVKADNLLKSQGDKADARLYRLKGYSFDKLGDSLQALAEIETFFQKATADQINPDNYVVAAYNAAKLKTDLTKVDYYFTKAIDADTVVANKIDLAKKAADFFKRDGQLKMSANWFVKVMTLKPKPSNVDYYNAGMAFYNLKEFVVSDSLFTIYKVNYPKENVGYLWSFRSKRYIDTSMVMGLAVPAAIELITVLDSDKVKFKSQIIEASGYLANYYANIKSDYAASIQWFDKILEVDPTNADAIKYKDILTKRLAAPKK
jgi:tetratricopeptide (TPR) repeat protein